VNVEVPINQDRCAVSVGAEDQDFGAPWSARTGGDVEATGRPSLESLDHRTDGQPILNSTTLSAAAARSASADDEIPHGQAEMLPVPSNDIQNDTERRRELAPAPSPEGKEVYATTDTGSATIQRVASNSSDDSNTIRGDDPLSLGLHKRPNVSSKQLKEEHPNANKKKLKKYYTTQNELIDRFLGSGDEERQQALDMVKNGPKIKIAVYGSTCVNFFLFVIQLYAAISTGSLSLFATAADAFMDLVSSTVMLVTSRLASRPSVYKYPVGRTRIETMGIILFCALMTTVAIQLIVESGRSLGEGPRESRPLQIIPLVFVGIALFSKSCLFVYCFLLRRYPAAHVFMIDHRNDLAVNAFGLVMSIIGNRLAWFLDPIGAICIGLLILFSWVATAFDHVWLLVGKSAPREFVSKLVYMSVTHDRRILKLDTVSTASQDIELMNGTDQITVPSLPRRSAVLCRSRYHHGP